MHVLVTRGGELAAVFGPVCSNPACECGRYATALDSDCDVDEVVVAERDDVTVESLAAACAGFLERHGWTDVADIALEMAEEAAEVADGCSVGMRLQRGYDHEDGFGWYEVDDDAGPLTLIEVLR